MKRLPVTALEAVGLAAVVSVVIVLEVISKATS